MSVDPESEAMDPSVRSRRLAEALAIDDPEQGISPEEMEKLRDEAGKLVEDAVKLYETKFANLPAVTKLRDLWRQHKIDDTDPVWMVVEALSLSDARAQLQLSQVVKILKAFDDLSRFSVSRLEQSVSSALELKEQMVSVSSKVKPVGEGLSRLERVLKEFNVLVPELLDVTQKAVTTLDTRNRRASWELGAMCAAAALVGAAVVYVFK